MEPFYYAIRYVMGSFPYLPHTVEPVGPLGALFTIALFLFIGIYAIARLRHLAKRRKDVPTVTYIQTVRRPHTPVRQPDLNAPHPYSRHGLF